AIRDDDPVVFCEPKALMFVSGPVAEGDYTVPLGKAALVREGADVSLVGFGRTVQTALRAAELLARDGVSADVLDLRSLQPLDEEAILATLGKTGRVVVVDEAPPRCGIASDVAALCVDKGFDLLNAPVRKVTAPHAPVPFSPVLEDAYVPTPEAVVAAAGAGGGGRAGATGGGAGRWLGAAYCGDAGYPCGARPCASARRRARAGTRHGPGRARDARGRRGVGGAAARARPRGRGGRARGADRGRRGSGGAAAGVRNRRVDVRAADPRAGRAVARARSESARRGAVGRAGRGALRRGHDGRGRGRPARRACARGRGEPRCSGGDRARARAPGAAAVADPDHPVRRGRCAPAGRRGIVV